MTEKEEWKELALDFVNEVPVERRLEWIPQLLTLLACERAKVEMLEIEVEMLKQDLATKEATDRA